MQIKEKVEKEREQTKKSGKCKLCIGNKIINEEQRRSVNKSQKEFI